LVTKQSVPPSFYSGTPVLLFFVAHAFYVRVSVVGLLVGLFVVRIDRRRNRHRRPRRAAVAVALLR
jgi:hypothetical protein